MVNSWVSFQLVIIFAQTLLGLNLQLLEDYQKEQLFMEELKMLSSELVTHQQNKA